MTDTESRLSEPDASKLLARAAELDARIGHAVTLADLRHAALETSISPAAFDAAANESRDSTVQRAPQSALAIVAINVGAASAFWILLKAAVFMSRQLGGAVPLHALSIQIATGAGLLLAHRLGARLARDVLIAVGAGQFVVFCFGLAGIHVTEPHVLNWGVLYTGVLATLAMRICASANRPSFRRKALQTRVRDLIAWLRSRKPQEPRSFAVIELPRTWVARE